MKPHDTSTNRYGAEVEETEEVCLHGTLWRKWTRGMEEVCLFPSIWQEWTRTHPGRHGKVRRSRRRREKNKKHRRKHRRRQVRRRRRALRRKKLARRARLIGCRRPRVCLLEGASPGEGDEQVRGILMKGGNDEWITTLRFNLPPPLS